MNLQEPGSDPYNQSSYARAMIELWPMWSLKILSWWICLRLLVRGSMRVLRVNGKKKQVAIACKEVSNSNPFDVLNSVEKDDDLGTNGGHSKSARKGPNSYVSPTEQIIDGKLTLVDDDEKPLPKVVSTEILDSDSEVEDVVDDHAVFMTSTG
ncbi:hypothetical protein Tco_1074898 [Tanacetum coccineum]